MDKRDINKETGADEDSGVQVFDFGVIDDRSDYQINRYNQNDDGNYNRDLEINS